MKTHGPLVVHVAYLQVGVLGFVIAAGALLWVSRTQASARAADAIRAANDGRAHVLAALCDASEAGWARLVRAALAIEMDDAGGYRDAPESAPPELAQTRDAERARLRRGVTLGLAGAAAMLAMGVALVVMRESVGIGAFVAGVSALFVWRLAVNRARAQRAIDTVWAALGALAHVDRPPPPRRVETAGFPIRLPSSSWFGYLLAIPASVIWLVFIFQGEGKVDEQAAGAQIFMFAFAAPLFLVTYISLVKKRIALDMARGDLVVSSHVVGLRLGQTRIPLEIIRGAVVEPGKPPKLFLHLTAPAAQVEIDRSHGLGGAASRLNRLFESS
jgi:hypothetical protein